MIRHNNCHTNDFCRSTVSSPRRQPPSNLIPSQKTPNASASHRAADFPPFANCLELWCGRFLDFWPRHWLPDAGYSATSSCPTGSGRPRATCPWPPALGSAPLLDFHFRLSAHESSTHFLHFPNFPSGNQLEVTQNISRKQLNAKQTVPLPTKSQKREALPSAADCQPLLTDQ